MTDNNIISVSEDFYSIQGEGPTTGVPSIFIRLGGCNLLCGGAGTQEDGKLHNGATWRCDTIEVWSKAEKHIVKDYAGHIRTKYKEALATGCSLIITGGEPLMQLDAVLELLGLIDANYFEVETNGTLDVSQLYACQINCSPKLSNSGMKKKLRVNGQAIQSVLDNVSGVFKFVITSRKDLDEMEEVYIKQFKIPRSRVWLMPAASTRGELQERSLWLVQQCLNRGYNFSSRLQVGLWNQTTGV